MKKYILIFPILWLLAACTNNSSTSNNGKTQDTTNAVTTKIDTTREIVEVVPQKDEPIPPVIDDKKNPPKKGTTTTTPPKKETTPPNPPKKDEGGGKRAASLFDRFHTTQILVVTGATENSTQGILRLFEWDETKKVWVPKSGKIAVTLGTSGMAWARGMQPAAWNVPPLKKEGDGKAPEGIFEITSLFGYNEKPALGFTPKMPYTQTTSTWVCVDDINSSHYNQILDSKGVNSDWKSKEDMLRKDNLYELGAVVAYNTKSIVNGDGSCVFLHIWRAADKPTAGCTAMSAKSAKSIFSRLDINKKPLLIQLANGNYEKYKNVLQFP